VTLVPAFTGLGAPYWDASARGTIVGLTRGTTAAHIARATLEAIAFQVADVLAAMQADAGGRLRELRVDGGAAASDLLMQLQADLLGVPVVRPADLETTALGAFFLAGLAAGVWPSIDALASQVRIERTFTPEMPKRERDARLAQWRRAVERARAWDVAATPSVQRGAKASARGAKVSTRGARAAATKPAKKATATRAKTSAAARAKKATATRGKKTGAAGGKTRAAGGRGAGAAKRRRAKRA